ncbi:MAG TPA: hypothetical protein VLD36_08460 [Burkholderiales bacterium]|nr:hypothetical protein [Burkholderiales bacterium]
MSFRALRATYRHATIWVALALAAGCALSPQQKRDAINALNAEFRVEYERALAANGTRVFKTDRKTAVAAAQAAMTRLGMRLDDEVPALGYMSFSAPAPVPLTADEWERVNAADLPKARAVLRPHVGWMADHFRFEPKGLDIVVNVTVTETRGASAVSITMRMREVTPLDLDLPRRDYPPPTGVSMGLDKIWLEFEQALRARQR